MTPKFVLPPLYVVGVPRQSPRGSASPRCGSSPLQNGTKSQHNWNITFVNGPRQSSPDFEVRRSIFASQARTLPIMAPLHGQSVLPFRAVLYTWLWTRLHLVAIGTVFEWQMYLSSHQLPMPLHMVRSAPWNPFPSRRLRYPKTSKTSQKGSSHALALLPTRSAIFSSFLNVLVHHSASGSGSMSRSSNSTMMSFTMQIGLFLCCRRIASSCQPTSSHATRTRCHAVRQTLVFHFSSAFQSTYLATRPVAQEPFLPLSSPWRIHLEYLNSVSLFSKHANTQDILHLMR